jgi:hypothetical protein
LGWFPLPESPTRIKLANCWLMLCQPKPHIPTVETSHNRA